MKNKDILSLYEGLSDLRAAGTTRFSARVSFAIARNLRLATPIVEDFQASQTEILNKYGDPADEPGKYFIKDIPSYAKEIQELEELDVDLPIAKIQFSDIEHLELTVQEMDALYPMIEEEG